MSWKLLSKTGAARLRSRALALLALTVGAAVSGALLLHGAGATAATPTTFGRVDPGSAWLAMGADYKRSSRFQLPERAAVTHLVAHVDGLGGGLGLQQQLRFAVYADEGGVPGTLLGQTDIGTVAAGQAAGWLSLPMHSPLPLEAGAYHLAIHSGPTGNVARYSRSPDEIGLVSVRDAFADGPAASFGSGTADDFEVAVHALLVPVEVPDTQAPAAPSSLAVSAEKESLALSWAASTDDVGVVGYGAYLDASRVTETTATAYTFSGLACDTSYTLSVDAADAAGNRSPQVSIAARTAACAPVPIAAPSNLRVTDATETTVTLAWDPVVGALTYGAYRNGSRVAEPIVPSFTFGGLACGTSYTLAADAVDLFGARSEQTSISASTDACPPPSSAVCTRTLAPGGSLGTFLNDLRAGEIGCLRGGIHDIGDTVAWSASGGTIQAYPGEQPVLVGAEIRMSGSDQTIRGFTMRDVFEGGDLLQISGTRARVEDMELGNADRHGILLNTTARDATIARTYIHDVGLDTLDHGIYVQGSGHRIVNNVIARPSGYAVHLYASPSNVVVAQNTLVESRLRAGLIVRTSGTRIRVVNNIVADNATHGISYHSCGGDCVVDSNLAWNNPAGAISSAGLGIVTNLLAADPLFVDELYHVSALSPAVDSARADYSFSPARDGVERPQGGAPDRGAYERSR